MEAASLALALLATAPVELPEQTVRVIEQAPMYSTAAHGPAHQPRIRRPTSR
jgi:hypothetical protein